MLAILLIGEADAAHEFRMGVFEEAQIMPVPGDGKCVHFTEMQTPCDGEFQRFWGIWRRIEVFFFSCAWTRSESLDFQGDACKEILVEPGVSLWGEAFAEPAAVRTAPLAFLPENERIPGI